MSAKLWQVSGEETEENKVITWCAVLCSPYSVAWKYSREAEGGGRDLL